VIAILLTTVACQPVVRLKTQEIAIDMEVGYPMVFGADQIWALCYVPRDAAPPNIEPDLERVCRVRCGTDGTCKVASASDDPATPGELWIRGRVFGRSDAGTHMFIMVRPFPMPMPGDWRDVWNSRLELQNGCVPLWVNTHVRNRGLISWRRQQPPGRYFHTTGSLCVSPLLASRWRHGSLQVGRQRRAPRHQIVRVAINAPDHRLRWSEVQ
jgi:hypothetical protein